MSGKDSKIGFDPLAWMAQEDGTDAAQAQQRLNEKPAGPAPNKTQRQEQKTMAIKASEVSKSTNDRDLVTMRAAVDGTLTPIMMVDNDLVITYCNHATTDMMTKHESLMKSLFRGFSVEGLVGTCIDMFHKNPEHQRKLLGNPNNLPYSTDINVGPLIFRLNVAAIMDGSEHIGCSLEWNEVTERRAQETQVARLQSAVNGAQSNLMICDEDLVITYCNVAVIKFFRERQGELRAVFPGLDADDLVGKCIDMFHKRPEHQRALLSDLSKLPYTGKIKLLDFEFEVNATAILGPKGEYMGNMVEWRDVTQQNDAERQVNELIASASAGELSGKIDTTRYSGFMRNLGEGINSLLDAVVTPIREANRVLERMAEGDLTATVEGDFKGEFGVLQNAINNTIENLCGMVDDINDSAGSIATAANEISRGNQDLSARTEEQASSLEETASSMEELTGTVKQTAENSREANQLSSGALAKAEAGGAVVAKTVEAMQEINKSSKEIADIISVIDEIAFQTNLLALNASVEAARAGDQGRGFAVVASEVRNLAQRSAGAAKEIKALIKDSGEKVDQGTKLVSESGKTLEEIVTSVKRVSDIIAEIAAASDEQATGIDQVNKAITQMDEVTQQNAALVEEAASASESLDEQAQGLEQLMEYFQITEAEPEPPQRRRANKRAAEAAPEAPAARRSTRDAPGRAPRAAPAAAPARARKPEARADAGKTTSAIKRPSRQAPEEDKAWEEF